MWDSFVAKGSVQSMHFLTSADGLVLSGDDWAPPDLMIGTSRHGARTHLPGGPKHDPLGLGDEATQG